MIDIHHHCLPGVDDGPREWSESVALCRMAAEEGIETIIATPHVLRGRWRTAPRAELEAKLAELQEKVGDTPHLVLGSEYFFAHDMPDVLAAGESIVPLAGGHWVLVELASNAVPPMIEQPFYRAQLEGWSIVLAHPERNQVLQSKPELLVSLIRLGVRMQVTSGSITGEFGREAQRCALDWLRRGYVHFVATDAHNTVKRPPRVREARARVAELIGEDVTDALFVHNPRAILTDKSLHWEADVPYSTTTPGLLDRIKGLFSK